MKTLVGMFFGMLAGFFLACCVIAAISLIGAGADQLGFTEWTARYYILCLGVSVASLCCSTHARRQWPAMIVFVIAVALVMGIGFQTFLGSSSGNNPADQMLANLQSIAVFTAKAVMYVAPGAVMAFLMFVAIEGVARSKALAAASPVNANE
ncbi:hypothetical protein [Pseudomonas abietaniphila]|uniref:Uncharacterized protein n=1 Tax=Pseudomonas abietaniphila TaxID=89065 RepID=A0A1G8R3Q4_9PSED|nr:hypothetical protein [Pseudomonas abietaniphila]SDJ11614.1 hypothetical protein SAMN05216605_121156 [Pseudomonas abietaniphila]